MRRDSSGGVALFACGNKQCWRTMLSHGEVFWLENFWETRSENEPGKTKDEVFWRWSSCQPPFFSWSSTVYVQGKKEKKGRIDAHSGLQG